MAGSRATGILTAGAGALLLAAAPHPRLAVQQLTASGTTADPVAPVLAALSLLAWGLAGWLAVTVLATAAGSCSGRLGTAGAAVSRRIAPAAVRRTVELTLGITVAVSALGTTGASAAPVPSPTPSPAATAAAPGPSPVAGATAAPAATPAAVPQLDWPASLVATAAASPALPSLAASAADPTTEPVPGRSPVPSRGDATLETSLSAAAAATTAPGGRAPVQVQPGDSLWGLAAAHLRASGRSATDAEIAQAWPQWWQANRQLVGDDPDLLHPGTALTPPA